MNTYEAAGRVSVVLKPFVELLKTLLVTIAVRV
jgi:hypothetical protein